MNPRGLSIRWKTPESGRAGTCFSITCTDEIRVMDLNKWKRPSAKTEGLTAVVNRLYRDFSIRSSIDQILSQRWTASSRSASWSRRGCASKRRVARFAISFSA